MPASVTVAVTIVVPSAKVVPLSGEYDHVIDEQLSEAVPSDHVAVCEHTRGLPSCVNTVRLGTQAVIAGGVLSITVTLKVQFAVFKFASRADQLINVTPLLKVTPSRLKLPILPALPDVAPVKIYE